MASTPTFQSNPYADFDPSQWSNPYSNYQNSPIPAASYAGWPTDANGNPIQPQPGMTLNSSPAQPAAAQPAAAPPQQQTGWNPGYLIDSRTGLPSQNGSGDRVGMGSFNFDPQMAARLPPTVGNKAMFGQNAGSNYGGAQTQQASAPPVASSTPLQVGNPLTPQQYLQLRANPGRVTTPGATVPIASGTQPDNNVLQTFLQNWRPAQSGPGSGFQQAFAKSLKGS